MADLGFYAADTMGVTLYQVNGKLKAHEVRQYLRGPWRIDMPIEVESDVLGARELGFWMTLAKTLRLYVVVREKENWLFVLNEAKALTFAKHALTVVSRVTEIRPAIEGVFHWGGHEWKRVEYDARSFGG